jgi:hypothetical protein
MEIKKRYSVYWEKLDGGGKTIAVTGAKEFEKESDADAYFNAELQRFPAMLSGNDVAEHTMFLVLDDKDYEPDVFVQGDDMKTQQINRHNKVAYNSAWRNQKSKSPTHGVDLYVEGMISKFYQVRGRKLVDVTDSVRV